ncbi:MAG: Trigger factor [Spirochaetes bacterium]|nr:MAG: Trigger factor [Spirochaetota bacterium]
MAQGSYMFSLKSILSQIKDMEPILFKKTDLAAFFKQNAQILPKLELSNLFEDLYAFNAYLGRLEGYPSIEAIPYWEYSTCLEWVDTHIMSGDLFDLNITNARRFLGSIDRYFEYLIAMGKLKNKTLLDTNSSYNPVRRELDKIIGSRLRSLRRASADSERIENENGNTD